MLYNPLLESFIQVVEMGSFSKAASRLYVSNTAIMKQMNQLESQLEIKLLERTHQGISPTQAGLYIYEESKKIIQSSNRIMQEAKKKGDVYVIRVGSSYLDPADILVHIWSSLSSNYPQFELEIVPFMENRQDTNYFIKSIGRDFDVLIGCHSNLQEKKVTQYYEIGDVPFCIAMNKEHELANHKFLTLKDLHGQTVMIGKDIGDSRINEVREAFLLEENIQLVDIDPFYDMHTFNQCASGHQLLLTLEHWKNIHPRLVTIPMDWSYHNKLSIHYSRKCKPEVEEFVTIIRTYLLEHPLIMNDKES